MRLFIAIELPGTIKDQVARLKTDIPDTVWTKRETYHLTLRFLGDYVAESRVFELKAALSEIHAHAFDVTLSGVGRFPPGTKKPAHVLWVGIAPTPPLLALYRAIEKTVTSLQFPADDHAFNPHITLARLKHFKPEPSVEAFLTRNTNFRTESFPVEAFHLFSSTLTEQGARYSQLGDFPLE